MHHDTTIHTKIPTMHKQPTVANLERVPANGEAVNSLDNDVVQDIQ
jgi:hypothetical protein